MRLHVSGSFAVNGVGPGSCLAACLGIEHGFTQLMQRMLHRPTLSRVICWHPPRQHRHLVVPHAAPAAVAKPASRGRCCSGSHAAPMPTT